MPLEVLGSHIGGDVVVLAPKALGDDRGFFMETYRADNFREFGLPTEWVQDNHSRSAKGVLRGLHFQWEPPMSKLMRVTNGSAFLVAVDIRKGSPTLGQWFGLEVSAENKKQVYAPYGFARGFCALTDGCEVQYKCTGMYNSGAESGISYKDPEIGVQWPLSDVQVSKTPTPKRSSNGWLRRSLTTSSISRKTRGKRMRILIAGGAGYRRKGHLRSAGIGSFRLRSSHLSCRPLQTPTSLGRLLPNPKRSTTSTL